MNKSFQELKALPSNTQPKHFDRGDQDFLVNGRMMKFPEKIWSMIELKDKVIVGFGNEDLENKYPKIEYWRQVFAYDFGGNVLWQVENPWYIDRETGKRIEYDNNDPKNKIWGGDCVDGILYNPELKMIVAWGRVGYQLDTSTGKLLKIVARER